MPTVRDDETRRWLATIGDLHALTTIERELAFYLEEGYVETGVPSTIIDATSLVGAAEGEAATVRILRDGAISREQLAEVLGDLLEPTEADADADPTDTDTTDTDAAEADGTA